jgi:hypothetical protein
LTEEGVQLLALLVIERREKGLLGGGHCVLGTP